ncbi:MAG: SDR family oxidoreductase [Burkholderiales bacterium]|nr:SDR family oxidoreductase [Burkholderiales bacterium]
MLRGILASMPLRVFITGASSGLGAELARAYAGPGAVVAITARRREELESVAAGLSGTAVTYPLDVTDSAALAAAAADFITRFGVPDIVIANAGISAGTLTELPEDLAPFERIFKVNVVGMFATFAPFIGAMRARGGGTLAGIASVAGIRGIQGSGGYCASKSAAITYLEALRGEMRPCGIRVVTILPGYIRTPLTAQNPYRMPFLLEADDAARRIRRRIDAGASYAVVPWQMGIVAKALRLLPNALFDRVFAGKARKPRAAEGQKI